MIRLLTLGVVLWLGAAVSGCRHAGHRPTPPNDPGRWTVTKYLVRVYEVDLETAAEAARTYLALDGFDVRTDRVERRDRETTRIIHAFTPGGALAYHAGEGSSAIFRLRRRDTAPAVVAVELKIGPSYARGETRSRMDTFDRVLYEVVHDRRARGRDDSGS